MFDWYTTMNQPDWDGRTYALPLPSMMPPLMRRVKTPLGSAL